MPGDGQSLAPPTTYTLPACVILRPLPPRKVLDHVQPAMLATLRAPSWLRWPEPPPSLLHFLPKSIDLVMPTVGQIWSWR